MSEPKWTPGPWFDGGMDHHGQSIVRQEFIEICTCWHHSVGAIEQEMKANARLIAAAPELYDYLDIMCSALMEMTDLGGGLSSDVESMLRHSRELLAKTRGEP